MLCIPLGARPMRLLLGCTAHANNCVYVCLCKRMNNWFHFNDIVAVALPLFWVCSVFVHCFLPQLQLQSFYCHFCWRAHIFTILSRLHSSYSMLVLHFYHRSICRLSITTTRTTLVPLVELSNCRLATGDWHPHWQKKNFFYNFLFTTAMQIVNLLLSVDEVSVVSLLLLQQLQAGVRAPQRMQHFMCIIPLYYMFFMRVFTSLFISIA